jgi:hypothetical protein
MVEETRQVGEKTSAERRYFIRGGSNTLPFRAGWFISNLEADAELFALGTVSKDRQKREKNEGGKRIWKKIRGDTQ